MVRVIKFGDLEQRPGTRAEVISKQKKESVNFAELFPWWKEDFEALEKSNVLQERFVSDVNVAKELGYNYVVAYDIAESILHDEKSKAAWKNVNQKIKEIGGKLLHFGAGTNGYLHQFGFEHERQAKHAQAVIRHLGELYPNQLKSMRVHIKDDTSDEQLLDPHLLDR